MKSAILPFEMKRSLEREAQETNAKRMRMSKSPSSGAGMESLSNHSVKDELRKLLHSRRMPAPKPARVPNRDTSTQQDESSSEGVIGICLMQEGEDEVRHKAIWQAWAEEANLKSKKVQLYLLADGPTISDTDCSSDTETDTSMNVGAKVTPSWIKVIDSSAEVGDGEEASQMAVPSMTMFSNFIDAALQDDQCTRIVFAPSKSLPAYPGDALHSLLFRKEKSWIPGAKLAEDSLAAEVFPPEAIFESSSSNFVLTREHAVQVRDILQRFGDDIIEPWSFMSTLQCWKTCIRAEYFPERIIVPCIMGVLGHLRGDQAYYYDYENTKNGHPEIVQYAAYLQDPVFSAKCGVYNSYAIDIYCINASYIRAVRDAGALMTDSVIAEKCSVDDWKRALRSLDHHAEQSNWDKHIDALDSLKYHMESLDQHKAAFKAFLEKRHRHREHIMNHLDDEIERLMRPSNELVRRAEQVEQRIANMLASKTSPMTILERIRLGREDKNAHLWDSALMRCVNSEETERVARLSKKLVCRQDVIEIDAEAHSNCSRIREEALAALRRLCEPYMSRSYVDMELTIECMFLNEHVGMVISEIKFIRATADEAFHNLHVPKFHAALARWIRGIPEVTAYNTGPMQVSACEVVDRQQRINNHMTNEYNRVRSVIVGRLAINEAKLRRVGMQIRDFESVLDDLHEAISDTLIKRYEHQFKCKWQSVSIDDDDDDDVDDDHDNDDDDDDDDNDDDDEDDFDDEDDDDDDDEDGDDLGDEYGDNFIDGGDADEGIDSI
jgi:hypothetical protein